MSDTKPSAEDVATKALLSPRAAAQDVDADGRRIAANVRSRLFGTNEETVRIGRFTLLGTIGSGGMGVVYAARDEELNRKVAVKLIHGDVDDAEEEQSRLFAEAQALARLSHPNVVQVYEVGKYEGRVYVAMEFLPGPTLAAWVRDEDRPWRSVLDKYLEAGEGLAAAHAAGMIHRDLKPANLLLGADGHARVVDFGLARQLEQVETDDGGPSGSHAIAALASSTALIGTPAYMSPEQVRRRGVDARSDQYSFCVALYEALFGRRPHEGKSTPVVLVEIARGKIIPPPRNTGVPGRVIQTILRGLSRDPDDRFVDMATLLAELRRDPWTRRWQFLGATTLVSLTAVAAWPGVEDDPCADIDTNGANVWDDDRRAETRTAFAATELSIADASWQGVDRRLTTWLGEWGAARVSACEAHHVHRAQSAELHALRIACLDRRLAQAEALIAELQGADEGVVRQATRGVAALPKVARCDDAVRLRERGAPPDDERVAGIEARLASASAASAVGKTDDAMQYLAEAVSAGEDLDYGPLLAQALYERALVAANVGDDGARAFEDLERAADVAEAADDSRRLAEVWARLGHLAAVKQQDDLADWAIRRATSTLERVAGDAASQAHLRLARAYRAKHSGDHATAIAQGRAALERFSTALPATNPTRLRATVSVATLLAELGQPADALPLLHSVRGERQALLGPGHPQLAEDHANLGSTLGLLGRTQEARREYEAIVELAAEHPGVSAILVLDAHMALHQLELARLGAKPDTAAPHNARLAAHRLAAYELVDQLPATDARWSTVVLWRADEHRRAREYQDAIALYTRCVEALDQQEAVDEPNYARCRWLRAEARFAQGQIAEPRAELRQLVERLGAGGPPVDPQRIAVLDGASTLLRRIDAAADAAPVGTVASR